MHTRWRVDAATVRVEQVEEPSFPQVLWKRDLVALDDDIFATK
jgi:hypothetical protein